MTVPQLRGIITLMTTIGVPKEIKTHEYRVGLTPGAVRERCRPRPQVLVMQPGAGHRDRVSPTTPIAPPARRWSPDAAEVFADAELIVKVKEPQPVEIADADAAATCCSPISTSPPDRSRRAG